MKGKVAPVQLERDGYMLGELLREILFMEYPREEIEKGLADERIECLNFAATYGFSVAKEKIIELVRKRMRDDGWIYCGDGKNLPEEHESIFAKFKGTDKWNTAMFEKISDKVIVTVEYENGERATKKACTIDGKWEVDSLLKNKVIAWQPFPEPYHPQRSMSDDYKQRIMEKFLRVE